MDPNYPSYDEWKTFEWRRIGEAIPRATLFEPPLDAGDIRQGKISDCWFMSALAVLTYRAGAVENLFLTKKFNKWGVYALTFQKNGAFAASPSLSWNCLQASK